MSGATVSTDDFRRLAGKTFIGDDFDKINCLISSTLIGFKSFGTVPTYGASDSRGSRDLPANLETIECLILSMFLFKKLRKLLQGVSLSGSRAAQMVVWSAEGSG